MKKIILLFSFFFINLVIFAKNEKPVEILSIIDKTSENIKSESIESNDDTTYECCVTGYVYEVCVQYYNPFAACLIAWDILEMYE